MRTKLRVHDLERDLCRQSFFHFVKSFWHTVIPEKPHWNFHIRYLCKRMQGVAERVFRGEEKKWDLVVNVPPGTSKSSIISIFFPAWVWTRMPTARILGASYTHNLALDLSRKCRDVVTCDRYKSMFPNIKIRSDQSNKSYFMNTLGGMRLSVGAGGSPMGFHFHFLLIDDPINPQEAISDTVLKSTNDWIDRQISTRKIDARVTVMILVMQRLAQGDPAAEMLKKKKVSHVCLPATDEFDIVPAEMGKFYTDGLLDPVRLPHVVLDEWRARGDYFFCTPGYTPILMSNWREKKIQDVRVGDEVVGYNPGQGRDKGMRSHVIKSTVTRISRSNRPVVKMTMESGREVFCTPDHKWWTRRTEPGRAQYAPAKVGTPLYSVYDPVDKPTRKEQRLWDWLGGMFDGDGTVTGTNFSVCQSPTANPEIFERIGKVLDKLRIKHGVYIGDRSHERRREFIKSKHGLTGHYNICSTRSSKMRFLANASSIRKERIPDTIWQYPGKVAESVDRVVRIEAVGTQEVYGLTTTSGNYVAWGYASQNSGQYGQNPVPLGGGVFKVDGIRVIRSGELPKMRKVVRYWDKAGTLDGGDWTVGAKLGVDDSMRVYVLDVVRVRLDSYRREKLMRGIAESDGVRVVIGIEQEPGSSGKESAEATARTLIGYTVKLNPVSGKGEKIIRWDPFSTQVNAGNVSIVDAPWNKEYLDELRFAPFGTHDDQIDASSGAFSLLLKGRTRVGGMQVSALKKTSEVGTTSRSAALQKDRIKQPQEIFRTGYGSSALAKKGK